MINANLGAQMHCFRLNVLLLNRAFEVHQILYHLGFYTDYTRDVI